LDPSVIDYSKFRQPKVGEAVRVKFDPRSLKVKFDKSDPVFDAKAAARADRAEFEALRHAPPSAPLASADTPVPAELHQSTASAKLEEMSTELLDDSAQQARERAPQGAMALGSRAGRSCFAQCGSEQSRAA
jgi:hypothetical protein